MSIDLAAYEALRESGTLEAKLAQGGLPRSMWETYSAFANTDGGVIVLGLEETRDHHLVPRGVSNPGLLIKEVWDALNNPRKVSANLLTSDDIQTSPVSGGDAELILISVPRAPRELRPVYINNNPATGTYRRNGEGDYRCSEEDLRSMMRDASPSAEDAKLVPAVGIESVCTDALLGYRRALETARPDHPWLTLGNEDFLLRLGAAGRAGGDGGLHPTRAGLLMFGQEYEIVREFPYYSLDYRSYEPGHQERWSDRVISNDGTWSGNVYDFWRLVVPRATAVLRRPFALDTGLMRADDTTMHKAVREAVANALLHADYYGRRGVVIARHPDRLECSNPGDLRIPAAAALSGGLSDPRNPTLMKFFGLINACEKAGSGFDLMQSSAREAGARNIELVETHSPDRTALTLWFGGASAEAGFNAGPAGASTATGTPAGTTGAQATIAPATTRPGMSASISSATPPTGIAMRAPSPSGAFLPVAVPPTEEAVVLEYVSERGLVRRSEIQELLGVGSTKAKKLLAQLVTSGKLHTRGRSNQTVYLL